MLRCCKKNNKTPFENIVWNQICIRDFRQKYVTQYHL